MDKITFYRDRLKNTISVAIQGFVTSRVRQGLKDRGFRWNRESNTYTAPCTEEAESYCRFLEEVCQNKALSSKEPSPKRKTYYDLFCEGYSVEEIARINNSKPENVLSRLSEKVIDGTINYTSIMAPKRFTQIKKYLESVPELTRLTPMKERAPFEVEYWELRLVSGLIK